MKPVIIIALAFVLFVPISVYGASYDGTYNYWFTMYNDPQGNVEHPVPGGFIVNNNNISSNPPGNLSGSVSSGGSVNMSGVCPQSSPSSAKYTGTLSSDGRGGGEYYCDGRSGEGTWSVTRISGSIGGTTPLPEPIENAEEQQIWENAVYTHDKLVIAMKSCDLTNARLVSDRLYELGEELEDLGSIQKGQFIKSQALAARDNVLPDLKNGLSTAFIDRSGNMINLSCQEGDQFGNIQRGISNTADIIGWAIFVIVALGAVMVITGGMRLIIDLVFQYFDNMFFSVPLVIFGIIIIIAGFKTKKS